MALSRFAEARRFLKLNGHSALKARQKRNTLLLLEALEDRSQPSGLTVAAAPDTGSSVNQIDHFVIIYQENWSFDGLYGKFPGADGLQNAQAANTIAQVDKQGKPITRLPTPSSDPSVPGVAGLPVQPYDLAQYVPPSAKTGDIVHRFYHEQLQIDNGALEPSNGNMDKFLTWSDNPSLVQGYYDATNLPEGRLAQQYTMSDNFFHSAYGGSFLNHQFLVSAAPPQWQQPIPAGFQSSYDPVTKTLNDSNLTIDGKYVVNTTFAAQGPHPASVPASRLLNPLNDSDPSRPDYTPTIGDRLDQGGLNWKWYSGGWNDALAGKADPLFQYHHQPFAYFQNYAPFLADGKTLNPATTGPNAHLQDESNFLADVASGNLPAVSFVKPLGPNNEHPGYADLVTGQQHVADLVQALQSSPQWARTAVIITYDENGGRWDHVTPPNNGDGWGDGTRVPAIIISPLAKKGFVDHTQHDTSSILKTIEDRFGLQPLNARDASASSLASSFLPAQPKAAGPDQHVLILSVDGLHQADVADPALRANLTNLQSLQRGGVTYTNASTTKPSDSFPGTLSYLTGAGPGTTGVFYDDSYSRTLFAPGSNPATAKPGTEVLFDESIDKNSRLLSGGGNFDASSIDTTKLPVDAQGKPVFPRSFPKVNTVFDVAHQAGLYTAFSDKHPSYDLAAGRGGDAIDNLYTPEIAASVALYDPSKNQTINADALLASNPFADVSIYRLVDASTDPLGANDPNLEPINRNVLLTERYDDLKVQAILNEINGKTALGTDAAPVPNLFAMNFQAVSVAQKFGMGGIVAQGPSDILKAAIQHTDASIGRITAALKGAGLWDSTELVVTAKHGQNPRVGPAGLLDGKTLPTLLTNAGVDVAQTTQDDVTLFWLTTQSQTATAVSALREFQSTGTLTANYQGTKVTLPANQVIDQILSGPDLPNAGFGDPTKNDRTPDIIVTLKPGFVWVGNPANFQFKRAEHGGFTEDDTHVPLIVSGGGLAQNLQGTVRSEAVKTTQIAVTALQSLGLEPARLQGAVIEGTQVLPGLGLAQGAAPRFTEGRSGQGLIGSFYDPSTTDNLNAYAVTVNWNDGSPADQGATLVRSADPNIVFIFGQHTFNDVGTFAGNLRVVVPGGGTINQSFTATVVDALKARGKVLNVNANQAINLQPVATFTDPDGDALVTDFTARINWGDGFESNGLIVPGASAGQFVVQGSHTYLSTIGVSYDVKVTIKDTVGSQIEADGKANVTVVRTPPTVGTGTPTNPSNSPPGPNGGNSITPQGWTVTPAGTQTQLGDRPFGIAISPDGKYLAVTNDGASKQSVMIVDRARGTVISEIDYVAPQGVYVGIAYSPDGSKLYASAGGTTFGPNNTFNGVRVYNVNPANGKLTETAPLLIPMPVGTGGKAINLFTAGLAVSADGKTLYVADNLGSALSVVDLSSGAATTGGAATTLQVGPNPYTVVLSRDGKTAYVSNQGGLTVSVVDLTRNSLAESDRVQVGTHPNAMALNPVNNELYVANADSDTVSVLDTTRNVVVRTIDLSPYPGAKEGSSPDALAVSPDGKTLYVANALNNDVAVITLGTSQGGDKVQGLIPTAWYPAALLVTGNGRDLYVLNAKGLGAGPNPGGPNPYTQPYGPDNQYIGTMIQGSLSRIAVPDAGQLAAYTRTVVANNGFNEGDKVRTAGTPQENVIPLRTGDPTPIKHVIYVIKVNRTYDQELGSLGRGNGDPKLNLFGDESAPNARALAKQFVTLDNFYSDAEVSADGWNWSTGATANSYVQHAWPQNYGGQNRPYDFEGGNLATSPGTNPTDAFIWNKLSDAGIAYRNYGFRVFGGQVAGNPTTEPRLKANTDLNFAGYDLRKPDSIPDLIQTGVNQPTRIAEWLKEFNAYEAANTLPAVEFVRLPNDHTATDTVGAPSPRAYVADNDYALGLLVQAVSKSKDWGSTAIFVIEDDAQEGPDHVDAHRTVAQVISPYTQTGKVDSTFYSQVSVLRTIEQIVGIAPMTQFDAAATPMLNSFINTPNMRTYTALVPTQDVHEKNPVAAPTFSPFASLAEAATAVDQNETLENMGIWKSIKGADSPMPAPKSSLHLGRLVTASNPQEPAQTTPGSSTN